MVVCQFQTKSGWGHVNSDTFRMTGCQFQTQSEWLYINLRLGHCDISVSDAFKMVMSNFKTVTTVTGVSFRHSYGFSMLVSDTGSIKTDQENIKKIRT